MFAQLVWNTISAIMLSLGQNLAGDFGKQKVKDLIQQQAFAQHITDALQQAQLRFTHELGQQDSAALAALQATHLEDDTALATLLARNAIEPRDYQQHLVALTQRLQTLAPTLSHHRSQVAAKILLKSIHSEVGTLAELRDIIHLLKALNHLELVGETLRHALNVLATVVPEWLRQHTQPEWFDRYDERVEDYRLPKDKTEREAVSVVIGTDGSSLLACIDQATDPPWLTALPAVQTLAAVWQQQYHLVDGQVQRRTLPEMAPVGEWLRSPYDGDVRYGKKREFGWVGYKVHLTECCDAELPHLITHVKTETARDADHQALEAIQADLALADRLPTEHLVDAGYISAKRILHSRDTHAIDLVGPVHVDPSWQAHTPGALDVSQFQIDWQQHQVTCPQGQHNVAWSRAKDAKGESVVQVFFAKQTCQACPLRERCTTARSTGRRMTLRFPQERHDMLQAARLRQQTSAFQEVYHLRAGIEGTFAQTTRNTGLRRARYVGKQKTHLQHLFSAVATNIVRLIHWRNGVPFAKSRTSRFAALAA